LNLALNGIRLVLLELLNFQDQFEAVADLGFFSAALETLGAGPAEEDV